MNRKQYLISQLREAFKASPHNSRSFYNDRGRISSGDEFDIINMLDDMYKQESENEKN